MQTSPKHISGRSLGVGTVLGIIVWLVTLILAAFSLWLFDFAIQAALFIPDKLGLVERPGPETKVSMIIPGQEEVHFSWVGTYQVYRNTDEYNDYKIYLMSLATNRPVEVVPLPRLDVTEDLPLFEFEIEEPGDYLVNVTYISGPANGREVLTMLPNVTNQNATVAVIGGIIQVLLFSVAGWGIYYWLNRKKFQAQAVQQKERRTEFESWLAETREKRKHKEGAPK
jgi:hypothetical protein